MQQLKVFLLNEKRAGKRIYPRGCEYFRALNLTPFNNVKVVILGQDPYHGPGQAHGLSFSVKHEQAIPPSLHNIYKELNADLGLVPASHGFLEPWAKQGVLLLNSVLTVEHKQAGSHQGKGWELFTDAVIRSLVKERKNLVFILWGNYAQKKGAFIDSREHCIIRSVHPSPLSAHRGFFGSRPFSRTNDYLASKSIEPIEWQLISDIKESKQVDYASTC